MKKFILSTILAVAIALYIFWDRLNSFNNNLNYTETLVVPAYPSVAPPTPAPTSTPTSVPAPRTSSSGYKDGEYTGSVTDAYYGNVQVKAKINGGKITDVQFLDYPQDRKTSQRISAMAMPMLRTEAIQAQSSNVDIVSGATQTSQAFIESLSSALTKAKS